MNIKKTIFFASLLCVLMPLFASAQFIDIDENHPHFRAIEYLREEGIVEGYPVPKSQNRIFKPAEPITRAEALKMILLISDVAVDLKNFEKPNFSDVSEKDWFGAYLAKAVQLKVIQGYSDGKFKPAQNLSVVEALKILLTTAQVDVSAYSGAKSPFKDIKPSDWFYNFVLYSADKNLALGLYDGNFDPNRQITRAQLAEVIYRLAQMKKGNSDKFNLAETWNVFEHGKANFSIAVAPNWENQQYDDTTIIWRKEGSAAQRFFAQDNPHSAYMAIFQDPNFKSLSKEEYFAQQRDNFRSEKSGLNLNFSEEKIGDLDSLLMTEPNISQRSYIYLPNKQVLVVFLQLREDAISAREKSEILAMKKSIRFRQGENTNTSEDLLSAIRAGILIEGQGKALISMMGDAKIIETDTIGVGTGPVDYFYSEKLQITVKHERSGDLILDLKKGRVTDF